MSTITTKDGTQIYYKDWDSGQPVVFSHGWPLSADCWEGQMMFPASNSYRCIAHDRRSHSRSSQPWRGNDMDAYASDRSQLYKDLASGPFFGANRPGAKISQGMIDSFWLQGMQAGHKNTFDCIKAFSERDFTEDLMRFDVPTLILHGNDDQIVPISAAALRLSKLVRNATLKIYPGAPHGLVDTHKGQLNTDLLEFLKT
jgi:pimeloyl-ACP methyl ester carboxylesterase